MTEVTRGILLEDNAVNDMKPLVLGPCIVFKELIFNLVALFLKK